MSLSALARRATGASKPTKQYLAIDTHGKGPQEHSDLVATVFKKNGADPNGYFLALSCVLDENEMSKISIRDYPLRALMRRRRKAISHLMEWQAGELGEQLKDPCPEGLVINRQRRGGDAIIKRCENNLKVLRLRWPFAVVAQLLDCTRVSAKDDTLEIMGLASTLAERADVRDEERAAEAKQDRDRHAAAASEDRNQLAIDVMGAVDDAGAEVKDLVTSRADDAEAQRLEIFRQNQELQQRMREMHQDHSQNFRMLTDTVRKLMADRPMHLSPVGSDAHAIVTDVVSMSTAEAMLSPKDTTPTPTPPPPPRRATELTPERLSAHRKAVASLERLRTASLVKEREAADVDARLSVSGDYIEAPSSRASVDAVDELDARDVALRFADARVLAAATLRTPVAAVRAAAAETDVSLALQTPAPTVRFAAPAPAVATSALATPAPSTATTSRRTHAAGEVLAQWSLHQVKVAEKFEVVEGRTVYPDLAVLSARGQKSTQKAVLGKEDGWRVVAVGKAAEKDIEAARDAPSPA